MSINLPFRRLAMLIGMVLLSQPTFGTHYMGSNLTIECINACTTRVHLRTYRDCTGSMNLVAPFSFSSTMPGCTQPQAISNMSIAFRTDFTPVCPSAVTYCANNNAVINGVEEIHTYQDFNVCSQPACVYTLAGESCCRNGSQTSGAANQGHRIETIVGPGNSCNSSPIYSRPNFHYVPEGMRHVIYQGGYDPDGDSLAYSLAACKAFNTNNVTYNSGYSPAQPLGTSWDFSLDPHNGMLTLEPQPGNVVAGAVCIQIDEYRNGLLIGRTVRDYQMTVFPTFNNVPPEIGPISNLSNHAALSGSDTIYTCVGSPLCFDIAATDQDSAQIVELSWDAHIPGATFAEVGNPSVQDTLLALAPNGQFCWSNPTAGTYQFLLHAQDDNCPIYFQQDKLITIVVGTSVPGANLITNSNTLNTCTGSPDSLFATPGYTTYAWSNGATTANTTVTVPGTYTVTATSGNCQFTSSFTVPASSPPALSGNVLLQNSQAMANTPVHLFRLNHADSSLVLVDSTLTDANGDYTFCTVAHDTVYIQALPDLATYPDDMLSYADTSMYWNKARAILATSFPAAVNFTCRPYTQLAGQCSIAGNIVSQVPGGTPVAGIRVILRENATGTAVGYRNTDALGAFAFTNLVAGSYSVTVDKPYVDEVIVPIVNLSASSCSRTGLEFILHPTYLELLPVGIGAGAPEWNFSLQPNPADHGTHLDLVLTSPEPVRIQIIDAQGRTLFEMHKNSLAAGRHQFALQTEALPAGMYWIALRAGNARRIQKLLVLHE